MSERSPRTSVGTNYEASARWDLTPEDADRLGKVSANRSGLVASRGGDLW